MGGFKAELGPGRRRQVVPLPVERRWVLPSGIGWTVVWGFTGGVALPQKARRSVTSRLLSCGESRGDLVHRC